MRRPQWTELTKQLHTLNALEILPSWQLDETTAQRLTEYNRVVIEWLIKWVDYAAKNENAINTFRESGGDCPSASPYESTKTNLRKFFGLLEWFSQFEPALLYTNSRELTANRACLAVVEAVKSSAESVEQWLLSKTNTPTKETLSEIIISIDFTKPAPHNRIHLVTCLVDLWTHHINARDLSFAFSKLNSEKQGAELLYLLDKNPPENHKILLETLLPLYLRKENIESIWNALINKSIPSKNAGLFILVDAKLHIKLRTIDDNHLTPFEKIIAKINLICHWIINNSADLLTKAIADHFAVDFFKVIQGYVMQMNIHRNEEARALTQLR